ncbi:MAG: 23S rRNA (guanosine(2251)-2'-O)-methyltransferase RlmB [Muribaculaceae bacterium]|nr:23S rRNA (guanosine(2251)-2'-O)-methyltransferase RlmB [Muribaculaceae bacterium]MBQ5508427.1 23S rRNA (guanosine(2251)-2'-O)-methyltransferase RlmB [Muribaculaceae bacterium]MDY6292553.1 23S rRNA (guanosine(2251)-2'-O)-methyltransferase RlmB [Bacteroidales bacterium]MDY6411687.1 23S rRNA (guanosine(2251)-2'-O)-methyltransferase RlmB [Bacteroidales bacterium]
MDTIFGLHAIIEAIEAGKTIDKLLLKKDLSGDLAHTLINLARERDITIQRVPIEKLNRITRKNHQGAIAMLAAVTYYKVDQVLPAVFDEGMNPFFVILDGVTDVRNFGAIARTCDCAGVSAIVIPEKGSVSVNGDAIKTSAGALNYLPVCREHSLKEAITYLRQSGCRIIGTSDKNSVNYTSENYTGPVALVLGSEGKGISPEVMRQCDAFVKIPEFGNINSLNVSVAGGIMMYEVVRQRLADGQGVE